MALTVFVFDVGETLVDEARHNSTGDPRRPFAVESLHPDALPCLAALRERGLRLGAAGNMRIVHEDFLRPHMDFVGSSERWDVWKPAAGFFERVVEQAAVSAEEIAYVGDRVDNDVLPAGAAGMTAGRIRRGAHEHVDTPDGVPEIATLADLPQVLGV